MRNVIAPLVYVSVVSVRQSTFRALKSSSELVVHESAARLGARSGGQRVTPSPWLLNAQRVLCAFVLCNVGVCGHELGWMGRKGCGMRWGSGFAYLHLMPDT